MPTLPSDSSTDDLELKFQSKKEESSGCFRSFMICITIVLLLVIAAFITCINSISF